MDDAKITLEGPKYAGEIDIGFTRLKVDYTVAKTADDSGQDKGSDDSDDGGTDAGGVL